MVVWWGYRFYSCLYFWGGCHAFSFGINIHALCNNIAFITRNECQDLKLKFLWKIMRICLYGTINFHNIVRSCWCFFLLWLNQTADWSLKHIFLDVLKACDTCFASGKWAFPHWYFLVDCGHGGRSHPADRRAIITCLQFIFVHNAIIM